MRVLLIHQAFASINDPGGTRHFELARACVKAGMEFIVVGSKVSYLTGNHRSDSVKKRKREYNRKGITIQRAMALSVLHRSFLWRIASFVVFMFSSFITAWKSGRVDVVMGTSPPLFQCISAWLIAAIRRRPFLLEIRDLWPEFAIDMGILRDRLLIALSRRLERFLYQRATHILVNSPAYVDYLVKKGIKRSKILLIPNGVDPSMFIETGTSNGIRSQYGLKGKFVVSYTGALGVANDIPVILKAADRLREYNSIRFLLVGDGKEASNLKSMANRMNLENVIFAGAKSKSEMPAFLAASDVCVATLLNIPMFRTTFPNKVFDYMAAGRPTILAIDGVIRKVLEEADGGVFVPPGNDKMLSEVVLLLSNKLDYARQMGMNAKKYVTKNFNRADHANQFIQCIEEVCSS